MNRADYNVGNLESKVELQINEAVKSIETLVSSLGSLKSALNGTINSTNTNKLKNNIDSSVDKIGALKKAFNFGGIAYGLRKSWNAIKDITSANIDMIETTNLFEVQMGKVVDEYGNLDEAQSQYYTKAMAFQNKMNEKLATNKSEMQKYQAMYYGMLNSQLGSKNRDASYLMSESLTKAGYDIASLYNLNVEDAMNKLKSGLAGQIESLRQIGIDVSEASLSRILDQVGIERSVQQLSYAEKEVARYIAICQQAGQAQGDFARTFEQPANQLRVFQNQLIELKQVAGSFIVNTFGNIIVYANAVIMVIKEILKAFANLFGYDLNVGEGVTSSLGGVSDTVGDIGSGLGNATKKAKEFKKQLMGFDEINNIEPPTQSSGGSGSGGGAVGGIDSKLLDALKEWDNKMDSIRGKAQEIRDKMLDWLGFVRNDDGTWKLKEGLTNFEKILDIVKTIGLVIASWKVASTVANLLKNLGVLNKTQAFQIAFGLTLVVSGFYLLYKGIRHILEGDVDLFTILEALGGGVAGTLGLVSLLKGIVPNLPVGKAVRILFGLELVVTSALLEFNGIKKVLSGNLSKESLIEMYGSALGLGAGTLLITKNIKISLIVTSFALAFDIGIAIGEWINQNFGDSYDWYLKVFNVHLEDGIDFTDILGIIGTMLGTIGDTILEGLNSIWNSLPKNIQEGIKKGFRTALAVITGGLSEVVIKITTHWKDIKKIFEDGWNVIVDFFAVSIPSWYNEKIAPWFTKEKWFELADKAKQGIEEKFREWKEKFNTIKQWYDEKIAPWFTIEKWKQVANNAKTGIENKFNEWKNNFNPISDWWNNKISPWFTWERWRQLGNNAVQGIQNAFSNFNFRIKMPHFSWTSTPANGWIANVLSALNLPTSLPKLNVSWYASGGMPNIGELFVAREKGPEMVGKIGNKTTVANNMQIVEGIKKGVQEGILEMTKSLRNTREIDYSSMKRQILSQSQVDIQGNIANEVAKASYNAFVRAMKDEGVNIEVKADEGIIFKKVQKSAKEYTMQTGEPAFDY